MQQMIFIADLIAYSTCFGHHYAHHQEFESIIRVVVACGIWCFGFQVVGMVWSWELCVRFAGCCSKAPNTTGSNHLYNTLELLMMGVMVPETCWASNKICNKNHMLHVVGILFPHINTLSFNLSFCIKVKDPLLPYSPFSFVNPHALLTSVFAYSDKSRFIR